MEWYKFGDFDRPLNASRGLSINQSINQSTFVKRHKSRANRRRYDSWQFLEAVSIALTHTKR